MDFKTILENNLTARQLNCISDIKIYPDGTFEYKPTQSEEEYYCFKGKIVGVGIVIQESNYYISGLFDEYTPITYEEKLTIKNIMEINFCAENSYTVNLFGKRTNAESNILSNNSQIIENLYNKYEDLISDIKNNLSMNELKEKYGINNIIDEDIKKI